MTEHTQDKHNLGEKKKNTLLFIASNWLQIIIRTGETGTGKNRIMQ